MTYTDDIRKRFYLAAVFDGFEGPDRVAEALSSADLGLVTVDDLLRLSLPEIRRAMQRARISDDDQQIFLSQMKASRIYPRGISGPQ